MPTRWRATGPYLASSALFTGILSETRDYLRVYGQSEGSVAERAARAASELVSGGLGQRARSSRVTIVHRINTRLVAWEPPAWVLDDLVAWAQQDSQLDLQAALLLHTCRQDTLLYNIARRVVLPRWQGDREPLRSADVRAFLAGEERAHPEILAWSSATRARLATTSLSIFRDYGLLKGKLSMQVVEPIVSNAVGQHLIRLLRAEGIGDQEIVHHPDWQLFLWFPSKTQAFISATPKAST
jgi:hypothetical protein